jgi:hypothetical protein
MLAMRLQLSTAAATCCLLLLLPLDASAASASTCFFCCCCCCHLLLLLLLLPPAASAATATCCCSCCHLPLLRVLLQDKDPSNHPAMWEMLLAFVSSQKPDCWATVNVQKAAVPRLLSLLRHGCYGSAVTSLPALLPFLAQLPRSAFALQPLLLLDQVLESIWIGQQQLGAAARGDRAVTAAVAAAYQECLCWGLRNAASLATANVAAGREPATAGSSAADSGSSAADGGSSAAEAYCSQLLSGGHFSSLLRLAVSSTSADAQLAVDIVQEVLLQLCNAPSAAATAASPGSSSTSSSSEQLPLQAAALIAAIGVVVQESLSSSCHIQLLTTEQEAAGSREAAAGTVCLRVQQLLDALFDSSSRHSEAAARRLSSYCCAALLPAVQAGQQLPAPAANLLARLIREHPDATQLPASSAAAAGGAFGVAGAAAGTSSSGSSSSIAALVKLGVGSCEAGGDLSSADAELLLSCVSGSSDAAVGWGLLLAELSSLGHSAAAWRFLESLLRQAASSSQGVFAAAGSGAWSHSMLDDYVAQVLQQLQQPEVSAGPGVEGQGLQNASSDSSSSRGLTRQQAAAAALLGCCLGANKQQVVLLGPAALAGVMESMQNSLAAALEQQQGQKQCAPHAAAAPFIAALAMVADSSTHVPGSVSGSPSSSTGMQQRASSSSRSLWRQQPDSLAAVLLLVWQLGWSAGLDGVDSMLRGLEFDASSSSGSSDAGSDAGSGSESSLSDSSTEDEAAAAGQQDAAAAAADTTESGAQDSSGIDTAVAAAWQALQAAATRLWTPEVISMTLTELPDAAASKLVQQLGQLLLAAVQEAAAAAGAGAAGAVVLAGTQLAARAAVVLEGLQGHSDEQQELLQQLLGAVPGWQRWGTQHGSTDSSSAHSDSSSADSSGRGNVDVWSSPEYVLMLQFSCVLVLQAGCDVVLPLHHGHLLSRAAAGSDGASSSNDAAARDHGRLWLRLELLCACTALHYPTAASAAGSLAVPVSRTLGEEAEALLRCAAAAAAAAERQLVKAAGKGSSGAASAVARSQLAAALGQLLSAALAACSPSEAGSDTDSSSVAVAQVYSQTLQQLLSRAVAAVAGSSAARVHLQPVLEQLMRQHVAPAVLDCASRANTASEGAGPAPAVTAAATLLAPVLQECAQAFRFAANSDAALTSSGFAELSVQLMHKATSAVTAVPLPLLQLAVACFPIQLRHVQQQHYKQGEQTRVAVCTAPERQGLAALLRHVCPTTVSTTAGTTATPAAAGSADASAGAAAASAQLQCQLQLCCVSYCWSDMAAAEWHIVLRDAQQRLTAARREVEKAAGGLAGAVCTAAQQLLGGHSENADAMSPAMAIQLLRRLEQKGLLQKTPAVAEALLSAANAAVQQLSQLWVLQLALEVLSSVLQLQDKVQAAGRAPQLGLALAAAWRELLSLFLALGAAVAVVSCCGSACSDVLLQYCQERGGTWLLLQQCLVGCSEAGGEAVGKVLAAANDKAELLGVDAVGCCLALLQQGGFHHRHYHQGSVQPLQQQQGCGPLQELAWELLLHPTSLASITHAAAASTGAEGEAEGVPEYGVNDDAAAYLVKVGLRPEMAAGLATSRPWQLHVLLWALLLAHVGALRARSAGQQRLCQALREVPELVPDVLDRVASLMGLGGSSKGSQAAAAAAAGETGEVPAATGALSPAAQASLSASLQAVGTAGSTAVSMLSGGEAAAAGSIWSVAAALRSIGLPQSHSSWRLLAAAVYRAVLCTLPASARLWFSDLRDRSRSTAVENYTSRYESPALLAAEFAAIKRDVAGSSGEVGGSCSFRVVANPASREVTAVLEIEDGATLELVVKLPASAPLKAPEVDCKNKVGALVCSTDS